MASNLCGIYKITCLPTNQCYIGQSVRINGRLADHRNSLKKGKHQNRYLQNIFNKYGEKNFTFELIELCNIEELDDKEKYWINYYGGIESKENCNFVSGGHKNKSYNEEYKKAKSKKYKGIGLPNGKDTQFKKGIVPWNKGKKTPPEIREKLSKAHLGLKVSEKTKKQISEHLKGKIVNGERYNARPVIMCDLDGNEIKEFSCLKLASEFVKCGIASIIKAIKKKSVCRGYKWKDKKE